MLKKHWVVLGLCVLASTAFADNKSTLSSAAATGAAVATSAPKSYDVLGGFAASGGQSLLRIGVGDPGLETTFLYGVTSKFNLGGLLALNWGEMGDFAIRFQIPLRFAFYNSGKLGVAAGFTPGIALFFGGGGTVVTIPLYLDLTTGYRITDELTMMVGFEVPFEIWTKSKMGVIIPLVAAAGFEYHIASSAKLWYRIRSGYAFTAGGPEGGGAYEGGGGGLASISGLEMHVGVAFAF